MSDAISLGDALRQFLNKSRLKNNIQTLQISEHWAQIMGATISKYTDRIELKNGTLFIHTNVAPLKNELIFQKELIISRMNENMGESVVTEVVVC